MVKTVKMKIKIIIIKLITLIIIIIIIITKIIIINKSTDSMRRFGGAKMG